MLDRHPEHSRSGTQTEGAACAGALLTDAGCVRCSDGIAKLLALHALGADEMGSVLAAHPSFDVWSFGAEMFLLLTGETLIPGVNAQENLNPRGLAQLAMWDDFALERRLHDVADPNAKDLLRQLLQVGATAYSCNHPCGEPRDSPYCSCRLTRVRSRCSRTRRPGRRSRRCCSTRS